MYQLSPMNWIYMYMFIIFIILFTYMYMYNFSMILFPMKWMKKIYVI